MEGRSREGDAGHAGGGASACQVREERDYPGRGGEGCGYKNICKVGGEHHFHPRPRTERLLPRRLFSPLFAGEFCLLLSHADITRTIKYRRSVYVYRIVVRDCVCARRFREPNGKIRMSSLCHLQLEEHLLALPTLGVRAVECRAPTVRIMHVMGLVCTRMCVCYH